MLDVQTIEPLVKIIEGGDASSQQFSMNIIGHLAKCGLFLAESSVLKLLEYFRFSQILPASRCHTQLGQ